MNWQPIETAPRDDDLLAGDREKRRIRNTRRRRFVKGADNQGDADTNQQ